MTRLTTTALLTAFALASACASSNMGGDDDTGPGGGDAGPGVDEDPLVCENPAEAGGFTFVEIATWRDRATAAYSMIHDDMCDYGVRGIHLHAVPALNARGLHAGLGPIVAECEAQGLWGEVEAADAAGHEIVSHSYTHPEITVANAPKEVVEAKAAFEQHTAKPVTFYIFPYDFWTPETVAAVGAAGHLGARAGNRDDNDGFEAPPINSAAPGADLAIEFDVWPRTYSKYALYREADILSVHVHNAVERGGWAVREFHSVIPDAESPEGHGFGPVPLSIYEAHLDFLVDAWRKGIVWTANPSTVIRYRHAREACAASVASDTITYDTSNPDCVAFATPISVIVQTGADVPAIMAMQGETAVATRKLGPSTFSVTADPTAGPVALTGCTDDGPAVETGQLPPRPNPADSVCDLESVAGTGADGQMDDLERPEAELQILPNPAQRDGRTGSWSWYPQDVVVELVADGGGQALRYAGNNLGAWTGVTLAFLGGNGAGTCYDASAYQGIKFRIKGSVTSTDDLNGKVVLSLVTAETQSRTFGGDLDGAGGHFHKVITLTPTWTTVTIPWADLMPPSWGDTATLTMLAKGKLQALDWGVSNMASSFEIYLDDIELY